MTDEDRDLVKQLLLAKRSYVVGEHTKHEWVNPDGPAAADRIEALEAENERLRGAMEAYAAHCSICSGGGSIVEEDSATGALLWRDCPGCTPARAALAGDSQ